MPDGFPQALRLMGYDPDSLYQELEMSSRFVDAHRDPSYSNTQEQLHSHTFYETIYCRTSCGGEYLVDAERYRCITQRQLITAKPISKGEQLETVRQQKIPLGNRPAYTISQ